MLYHMHFSPVQGLALCLFGRLFSKFGSLNQPSIIFLQNNVWNYFTGLVKSVFDYFLMYESMESNVFWNLIFKKNRLK